MTRNVGLDLTTPRPISSHPPLGVQVRQKAEHKKTLFYLEQLVLKQRAHRGCSGVKQVLGGIDFFYPKANDARRLTDFLMGVLPCRFTTAKELVSQVTSEAARSPSSRLKMGLELRSRRELE